MESKSLFHIEQELVNLYEQIELQGGELTEEQESFLQINEKELTTKALNYIKVINKFESDILLAKMYKEQAEKVIKQKQTHIDRMKDALKNAVELFGDIQTDLYKIGLRASESTIIENEDDVPAKFKVIKQTIVVDKAAVKNAIKNGETVKGAYLQKNNNLSIK